MLHGYRQLYSLDKKKDKIFIDITKGVERRFYNSSY